MKNTSIQFIKNLIMTASIAYVVTTFITMELNPAKWDLTIRAGIALVVVVGSVVITALNQIKP